LLWVLRAAFLILHSWFVASAQMRLAVERRAAVDDHLDGAQRCASRRRRGREAIADERIFAS
jgi:hypothetical protein